MMWAGWKNMQERKSANAGLPGCPSRGACKIILFGVWLQNSHDMVKQSAAGCVSEPGGGLQAAPPLDAFLALEIREA